MRKRVLRDRVVDVPQKIQIEQILPGLAAERARLNLRQIQIAQRESGQRPEQRAGHVSGSKHERGLPAGSRICLDRKFTREFRPPQEEKSSEVAPVVLDRWLEGFVAV